MASAKVALVAPSLVSFLKNLDDESLESSITSLERSLKTRQIRHSRACALATAHLLRRVVDSADTPSSSHLLSRVRSVGSRLSYAQPKELAVGNVVRRVLGVIRGEAEEDRAGAEGTQNPTTKASISGQALNVTSGKPATNTGHTVPASTSLFNLLEAEEPSATASSPGDAVAKHLSNDSMNETPTRDIRADVLDGIVEIIDEIDIVDDQIASSAIEHIRPNDVVLVYGSGRTAQKFLLKAAARGPFTLLHAVPFPPSAFDSSHAAAEDDLGAVRFTKPLLSAGVNVTVIPETACFALMPRVHKVILSPGAVLANGALLAAAGSQTLVAAANAHKVPVIALAGVFKMCPTFPYDTETLLDYGAPKPLDTKSNVALEKVELIQVDVPLTELITPDSVRLFVSNLGSHAPSALHRVIAEHYRPEDTDLTNPG